MPTPLKPLPPFFNMTAETLRAWIDTPRTDAEKGAIAGFDNGTPLLGRYDDICDVARNVLRAVSLEQCPPGACIKNYSHRCWDYAKEKAARLELTRERGH